MEEFGFHKMQSIQKELQEKYKEKWGGLFLCYSITPGELEKIYLEKHKKNMERW